MEEASDRIAEVFKLHNNMYFHDKCSTEYSMARVKESLCLSARLIRLSIDGYLKEKDDFAVSFSGGEAYVYLWKHICGQVFYVGSGKDSRYRSKNRGTKFLQEIDKADAVVYIVANNLSRAEAYSLEMYVSGALSIANAPLKNKDNIYTQSNKDIFLDEWQRRKFLHKFGDEDIKRVENAISKIIFDDNFTYEDSKVTDEFISEYGKTFFSENSD